MDGSVQSHKNLDSTVPSSNVLLDGTVPSSNNYLDVKGPSDEMNTSLITIAKIQHKFEISVSKLKEVKEVKIWVNCYFLFQIYFSFQICPYENKSTLISST